MKLEKMIFQAASFLLICSSVISGVQVAGAEDSTGDDGGKGKEIIARSLSVYGGEDQQSKLTFLIKDGEGEERKLVMRRAWKNLNGRNGVDSKVMIFQEYPPETSGSSFMGWFYRPGSGKKNEAWLYIPMLKKIEQLPDTENRDESFQESDIKPSDMMARPVELDTHRFLREETISRKAYYVVESVPRHKDPSYPYGKALSWISKDQNLKERVDFYDQDNNLVKKQTITWKKVKNAWVWEKVLASSALRPNTTTLNISEIKVDSGLKDDYFSQKTMKEGFRDKK